MKKLVLTTAMVAVTSTTAMASGFFAGLYGGYTGMTTHTRGNVGVVGANPTTAFGHDASGNGGQGGLQLGYDYATEGGLVFGVDLFGQVGSAKGELAHVQANLITQSELKQKHAFGVAARLGYMFDTTHAYLKVGYAHSRFDAMLRYRDGANAVNASNTTKLKLNGLVLGLGADMPVGELFTVGFSYDFTVYKNKTSTLNFAIGAQNNTYPANFRPRTHAINVVFKYKF